MECTKIKRFNEIEINPDLVGRVNDELSELSDSLSSFGLYLVAVHRHHDFRAGHAGTWASSGAGLVARPRPVEDSSVAVSWCAGDDGALIAYEYYMGVGASSLTWSRELEAVLLRALSILRVTGHSSDFGFTRVPLLYTIVEGATPGTVLLEFTKNDETTLSRASGRVCGAVDTTWQINSPSARAVVSCVAAYGC